MRRRLAVLLLALLGWLCASALLTPSSANAVGLDCKESPTPEVPGRGLTGFFQGEPRQLPPQENPFAPNARTTIYEQYGYAGLRWTTYDLGCGPDAARAPDATAGTAVANWLFLIPKAGVAFTNAVVEVAFRPTFLSQFDPLVRDVSDALYRALFVNWVPLVLVATGALLIWRARRADMATSTAAVGWAVLILVIATGLFRWPVEAGRAADITITSTLSAVNGGLNRVSGGTPTASTRAAASNTHETLLYQSWLAGTFGQSNSDTAKTYGPQLFDATALTWREAQILRQDPARGKTIIDDKKRKFADVASRVQSADPDAYEYLTGKRSESRVGYALLAFVGALFALPFLLGAALIVLAAFLVIRFAVMLFPAFATLALFPAMRRVVTGAGNLVAAALINGIIFAVSVIVVLRAIGLLLDPRSPLPRWLALTLMLLVSVVMWVVLRPVRKLGSLVLSGAHVVTYSPDVSGKESSRARHARHSTVSSDTELSPTSQPLRSEVHAIPESIPSTGLPRAFRQPATGAGATPGQPATATPSSDAWIREGPRGGRPAVSRNGQKPVTSGDGPSDTAEAQTQEAASPTSRENAPDRQVTAGQPARRTVGRDRTNVPPAIRSTMEEAPGPIYIPGPSPLGNGRTPEATTVRTDEEVMSPIYRPSDKGRAPTRSSE